MYIDSFLKLIYLFLKKTEMLINTFERMRECFERDTAFHRRRLPLYLEELMVHLADDAGVKIGKNTTIGHGAIIHGCEIGDGCLIGMGAIVLDKAVIGDNSIVGAGAVVTKGTIVPPGSMVLGTPAKVVKELDEKTREGLAYWAQKYVKLAHANRDKEAR